jgi:hypothetical protein
MTAEHAVLLAVLITLVGALAAWVLRILADDRTNQRDLERLREVDREWAAAVARWLSAPPR